MDYTHKYNAHSRFVRDLSLQSTAVKGVHFISSVRETTPCTVSACVRARALDPLKVAQRASVD